jgi:tripartite-type tricarboxylate transporter receptor subunit TctC
MRRATTTAEAMQAQAMQQDGTGGESEMRARSVVASLIAASLVVALLIAWAILPVPGALAQGSYPEQPIRYLLHVSPGGATDVMARKLGIGLEKILGKPVVVENKPGGRGAQQMFELMRAKPDGYTIASVTSSHVGAFNQTLKQFNVASVDWIANLVEEPYLFVVPSDSPIKSMKDLADAIRAKPGFVVAGFVRGSGSHFAWEMYAKAAGLPKTNINWVPYDSVGDAVTAVLGHHGQVTIAYLDLVKDHVEAHNLRVIGVMTAKRMSKLPDVPTLREQGFDVDTSWQQFRGIIGPKGTPDGIKQKLADAAAQVIRSDDMQKYINEASLELDLMNPAEFTAYARKQDQLTKEWMQTLNLVR